MLSLKQVEFIRGMETVEQEITARNLGEKQAQLSYLIRELTVLGETFSTEDGVTTPEDLLLKLQTYPFKIEIIVSDGGFMEAGTGVSTITISLTWPFELTEGTDEEKKAKDLADTEWGEAAYTYYKEQLDLGEEMDNITSINMKIELRASQV